MVALVHSAICIWIPIDRENIEGFSASWQPLTLRAADSHIHDIMDALAGLSSNEQNPNIACALVLDYTGKIEIVIASANEVTHHTQEHIRNVWENMVEISVLTRYSRSHGVDDACEKQKSRALIRSLYQFCIPTFSRKFLDNIRASAPGSRNTRNGTKNKHLQRSQSGIWEWMNLGLWL